MEIPGTWRENGDGLVETRSRKEKFHVGNYIDSRAGARVDRCDTDLATQSFVGLYAQRFVGCCGGHCACVAASGPDISERNSRLGGHSQMFYLKTSSRHASKSSVIRYFQGAMS